MKERSNEISLTPIAQNNDGESTIRDHKTRATLTIFPRLEFLPTIPFLSVQTVCPFRIPPPPPGARRRIIRSLVSRTRNPPSGNVCVAVQYTAITPYTRLFWRNPLLMSLPLPSFCCIAFLRAKGRGCIYNKQDRQHHSLKTQASSAFGSFVKRRSEQHAISRTFSGPSCSADSGVICVAE